MGLQGMCVFQCVFCYNVMYHYCYLHVLFSHVACIKPEILDKLKLQLKLPNFIGCLQI